VVDKFLDARGAVGYEKLLLVAFGRGRLEVSLRVIKILIK